MIEEVGARRTALARKGPKRFQYQQQLVAANADQLAVVVAKPRIALAFIDRCFLAAKLAGLTPLLVANKLDLDPELIMLESRTPTREREFLGLQPVDQMIYENHRFRQEYDLEHVLQAPFSPSQVSTIFFRQGHIKPEILKLFGGERNLQNFP